MNSSRSLAWKGVGLLTLLALLVVLVLVNGSSASAPGRDRKDAPTNPVVVIKTRPGGAIECSDLTTSAPGREGTLVYQWTGPRLQTARCEPAQAAGMVGLG